MTRALSGYVSFLLFPGPGPEICRFPLLLQKLTCHSVPRTAAVAKSTKAASTNPSSRAWPAGIKHVLCIEFRGMRESHVTSGMAGPRHFRHTLRTRRRRIFTLRAKLKLKPPSSVESERSNAARPQFGASPSLARHVAIGLRKLVDRELIPSLFEFPSSS